MPNIKHNPDCPNLNCMGGVITYNGSTGKLCKKCNPTPASPTKKRHTLHMLHLQLSKALASQGVGPKFSQTLENRIIKLREKIQAAQ